MWYTYSVGADLMCSNWSVIYRPNFIIFIQYSLNYFLSTSFRDQDITQNSIWEYLKLEIRV